MAELILNSPPLVGITLLFINNLFASMYVVLLGIILGLPPLLGLFTNGAFLGTVITSLGDNGISGLAFSLWEFFLMVFLSYRLFLSAAFGLKLGFHIIFPLPQKRRAKALFYLEGILDSPSLYSNPANFSRRCRNPGNPSPFKPG